VKERKSAEKNAYDPVERYRKFVEDGVTHGEQKMLIQTEIGEDDLWHGQSCFRLFVDFSFHISYNARERRKRRERRERSIAL